MSVPVLPREAFVSGQAFVSARAEAFYSHVRASAPAVFPRPWDDLGFDAQWAFIAAASAVYLSGFDAGVDAMGAVRLGSDQP